MTIFGVGKPCEFFALDVERLELAEFAILFQGAAVEADHQRIAGGTFPSVEQEPGLLRLRQLVGREPYESTSGLRANSRLLRGRSCFFQVSGWARRTTFSFLFATVSSSDARGSFCWATIRWRFQIFIIVVFIITLVIEVAHIVQFIDNEWPRDARGRQACGRQQPGSWRKRA